MKIVIAGGSGFIGQKLTDILLKKGMKSLFYREETVRVDGNITYVKWLQEGTNPEKEIVSADAFINLAGVSINEGRWTAEHQKQIYDSRMEATDELLRIISALQTKPAVLVNASAIGIYPASEDNVIQKNHRKLRMIFLPDSSGLGKESGSVETEGVRAVFMRFGVILGKDGGALASYGVTIQIICRRNSRFG